MRDGGSFYPDWHYNPLPLLEWRGTPQERDAARRYLARLSRGKVDGATGLQTVIQALGLDEDLEAVL